MFVDIYVFSNVLVKNFSHRFTAYLYTLFVFIRIFRWIKLIVNYQDHKYDFWTIFVQARTIARELSYLWPRLERWDGMAVDVVWYVIGSQSMWAKRERSKFPLTAHSSFRNPRSPLRDLPLPSRSRSTVFLKPRSRSNDFRACSAPFSAPEPTPLTL